MYNFMHFWFLFFQYANREVINHHINIHGAYKFVFINEGVSFLLLLKNIQETEIVLEFSYHFEILCIEYQEYKTFSHLLLKSWFGSSEKAREFTA